MFGASSWEMPRPGVCPSPQNQVPNRIGMGAPDASAVPLSFRKKSSIGSPTATIPPPIVPRRNLRRVVVMVSAPPGLLAPWRH